MLRPLTRYIVVHHTDSPQTMSEDAAVGLVYRAAVARGLAYDGRMAYHYLIGKNWVYQGRPENTIGYHAGNWVMNRQSIAVALVGRFDDGDQILSAQKDLLGQTLRTLTQRYKLAPDRVILHRDVKPTACPGGNINQAMVRGLLLATRPPFPKDRADRMFRVIWGRAPAEGDLNYFLERWKRSTILDEKDMATKMTVWYAIVYPWNEETLQHEYDSQGDQRWQEEKNKVLT